MKILFVPSSSASLTSMKGNLLREKSSGFATSSSVIKLKLPWFAVSSLIPLAGRPKFAECTNESAKSASAKVSKEELIMMMEDSWLPCSNCPRFAPTHKTCACDPIAFYSSRTGAKSCPSLCVKDEAMTCHALEHLRRALTIVYTRDDVLLLSGSHWFRKYVLALSVARLYCYVPFLLKKKNRMYLSNHFLLCHVTASCPVSQCESRGLHRWHPPDKVLRVIEKVD